MNAAPSLDTAAAQAGAFFSLARPREPSRPHQRLYIRTLLQQLDIDTLHAGADFIAACERAKVPAPGFGARIDSVLVRLTCDQAKALAGQLAREVPRE